MRTLCAGLLLVGLSVGAGAAPAAGANGGPEDVLITQLRDDAVAYEHGENGYPKDPDRAVTLYCKAARLGDSNSQFSLGWMYANGRGVERNDSLAAFFFFAAAEQGHEQAQRMLDVVGGPTEDVPECIRQAAASRATLEAAMRQPHPVAPVLRSKAPRHLVDLVRRHADLQRVPAELVLAIMEAESRYDVSALSPRGARGLMQLMPDTAVRFGVRNAWDPAQSVRGGTAYLRWLLAYFEGDVSLVAAAYNAGERTVERYRGVPPFVETRAYVRRVLQSVGTIAYPFDPGATVPSPRLPLIRRPPRGG